MILKLTEIKSIGGFEYEESTVLIGMEHIIDVKDSLIGTNSSYPKKATKIQCRGEKIEITYVKETPEEIYAMYEEFLVLLKKD